MNITPAVHVRAIKPSELTPETIRAWAELESTALQPNAFLSPYFILPSIHHITRPSEHLIVLVETLTPPQLLGIGVFESKALSLHLPMPHLSAYRSPHGYEDGLLVDHRNASITLDAFFCFLSKNHSPGHGIRFFLRPEDTPLAKLMDGRAHAHGFNWHEIKRVQRPILKPAEAGEQYLKTHLRARHKDCSRLHRRLAKQGKVTWHYVAGSDISTDTVEHFLELEHMGWKGDEGSSLASSAHQTAFFRKMIEGFQSQQRVFFAELRLDGRTIASICTLVSGNVGFGFKIGWHTNYAHSSPGILNEVELIRHAPKYCETLQFIDSGSSPGSYMERLWLDRRPLVSGLYTTTAMGNQIVKAIKSFRGATNL